MKLNLLPLVLIILGACAAPRIDYKRPAQFSYQPDLLQKAQSLEFEIESKQLINDHGMFVSRWYEPFDQSVHAYGFWRSHYLADGVAWHGYLMAALAFQAATLSDDAANQTKIDEIGATVEKMAGYYQHSYDITGQPGLICRSTLPGFLEKIRMPFMTPGTSGYGWSSFEDGTDYHWCLDRPNKDHVNMASATLGITLALDANHSLFKPSVKAALLSALEPMVRRLVNDNYMIRDHNGELTGFPDLVPNYDLGPILGVIPEGMNRITALQMLAAAAKHGNDPAIQAEYADKLARWGTDYAWVGHLIGRWVRSIGHWNRMATPGYSNPQALSMAATSFLLNEDREPYVSEVKDGLSGMWRYMKYAPNGIYTTTYLNWVDTRTELRQAQLPMLIDELQSIPVGREVRFVYKDTPRKVQPIHNRPMDTNYWKATPYERQSADARPAPANVQHLSGVDFLLSYWMSRYYGLLTETKNGI